ncbi:sterol desaturase family protein [Rhodanobacter denitrificans]|uniref:Sterol desaturase n=1 Tax=Rhodanobacter denitrificans TaxID=666685 RepID=I4WJZ0_9GAMM|nr:MULTISPECIES: sterol desaturase family protein [Rhodanobacter]AGG90641.1 sterol desaturase [Rhodanobacter denitrificans]EIL99781.1 putative Fa2h protein [Rhodanobacter denitrificans]UJM86022.1 sterol desaturase family protein [Rhodanobacter denitrificans]UJM90945.1 sterol desaturase family protein [Rhodanobacter denitrificans]
MKRSPWRIFVDAVMRMSATPANYWAELGVDSALCLLLLVLGWRRHADGPLTALLALGLGLFAFSFIEYFFHRWLFHTRIPLFTQGHDLHHARPLGYDSLPFFLPPAVLLALAGVFVLLLPTGFALLLASAITFGYIVYGLSHFIIHHVRFHQPLLRRWAGAHHVHHYHPDSNFGVTTPLWDVLLGTKYVRQPRNH